MQTTQVRWDRVRTLLNASVRSTRTAAREQLTDLRVLLLALPAPQGWQALWRAAYPVLGFAAGYLATYAYGNRLPSPAPLWLSDGVLLAALLLTPTRRWWIYVLVT